MKAATTLYEEIKMNWHELLARLKKPFPASFISWRAGAISRDRKRAQALPYADPRLYEDRLNEVCPGDWGVHFEPWGETRIICELTIHGVTRASTGEFDPEDRIAHGTAAEAQAFKRACSKFGLGRYLYDIPINWVDYDEERHRLDKTPELDDRFKPGPGGGEDPLSNTRQQDSSPAETPQSETLTRERAEAMRRELEGLGLSRREHHTFATAVLGRKITRLTLLSEAEALEVWRAARRAHDIAA